MRNAFFVVTLIDKQLVDAVFVANHSGVTEVKIKFVIAVDIDHSNSGFPGPFSSCRAGR